MGFNFYLVSILFLLFFLVNSYFISKIWTNKYTNFNFFESFNISLLILFFILFVIFTPILIIFKNVNTNVEDALIASKWILLIIQISLVITYLMSYKKLSINISLDIKKIILFFIFISIYFLVWFLLISYKPLIFDGYNSFKVNGESIFNIFNSIFIRIFYSSSDFSSFNINDFYKYILIPLNLFLIVFSQMSLIDFVDLKSTKNLKVFLSSIFILLFFCSNSFVESDNSRLFITNNIMWVFFPLISIYSIANKTNYEITTNSDLSLSINITILTLPFFFNDLYIFSIFIFLIFLFYMYSMKFEGSTFETLKLFSYTILSYSMSKLVSTPIEKNYLPWLLLVISFVLISITYAINRNHNFYNRMRKVDTIISKNIWIVFIVIEIVIISIFLAFSIGSGTLNELYNFFIYNGKINISFVIIISLSWFASFLFIGKAIFNKGNVSFNTPILLFVFTSVLVFNPFFKGDLILLIKQGNSIDILFNNSLIMIIIPILISYIGMSFKKNNNNFKNQKIYKISYILSEIIIFSSIIANICFYISYLIGVTKWIIF